MTKKAPRRRQLQLGRLELLEKLPKTKDGFMSQERLGKCRFIHSPYRCDAAVACSRIRYECRAGF